MNEELAVWGALLRLVGALLVVLPLAYGVTRWYGRSHQAAGAGGRRLAIVEGLSLGPRRGLYVVRVGSRYYLIGVTERHIASLGELPREEWAAGGLNGEPPAGGQGSGRAPWRRFWKRGTDW